MILHEYRIHYKHRGTEFRLKPCWDWHCGSKQCDMKALKKYLADGIDDPFCYLVAGGDLADSIITSDLKRYVKSTDATESQAIIDEQEEILYDLLKPYQGRIIGFGLGNHENVILKKCGTHISRQLAKKLETMSLGYQWAVQLKFCRHIDVKTLTIFGHHGWGGATRTEGGSITKYSNHAIRWECDMAIYGHDHQRKTNNIDFMGIKGKRFIPKDKRIFLPGTFYRTFSKTDEPSYGEEKGLNPVTIGGINIHILPERTWFKIWSDL